MPACGGVPLLPVCMVSSGGFPVWGHFGNLGLGTGSFMPGELCLAIFFGRTIVLEGVVYRANTSSQWCLDVRAGCLV